MGKGSNASSKARARKDREKREAKSSKGKTSEMVHKGGVNMVAL